MSQVAEMETSNKKTREELKNFGLVMAGGFAVLALLLYLLDKPATPYLMIVAAVFALLGVLKPHALAPVERLWMMLAERLGHIMTRVVLFVAFYAMVTPIALLLRLLRKDILSLKYKAANQSYWEPVEKDGPAGRHFKPY